MMLYGITQLVLGCRQFIELTPDQYAEAKSAKEGLIAALSIEEKLNLVLQNYMEFELELLVITTRDLLFQGHDWSSGMEDLHAINRRLANLLSACRLYIDQTKHEVSAVYGDDPGQLEQLELSFSSQYDAFIGYRAIVALRGHVQHRSLPIYCIANSSTRDEKAKRTLLRHTCTPSLSVRWIKEQGNFKQEVLEELETGDDLVDLKPLIREGVTCLLRVHKDLRQRMRNHVNAWEQVINSIQTRYRESFGDDLTGLAVVMKDNSGQIQESAEIFKDLIDRRKYLEKKMDNVVDLRSNYVSGEVSGDNK
jgi:hypothetical protein